MDLTNTHASTSLARVIITLSRIDAESPIRNGDEVLIFHCRSGARTQQRCSALRRFPELRNFVLEGGLDAWKKAGLPVTLDRSQPIDIMRQVQIVAGSLVLLGVILGTLVVPGFYVFRDWWAWA